MTCEVASVREITTFEPHPNADRLKIARAGSMPVAVQVTAEPGMYLHVEPHAFLPRQLCEAFGVWAYVDHKMFADQEYGRVRFARLRGVASYGFLVPLAEVPDDWPGQIVKYDPEIHGGKKPRGHGGTQHYMSDPVAEWEHPLFKGYGGIDNYHKNPLLFRDGLDEVHVTEKIHGTNSRVGLVRAGFGEYRLMVGSNNKRRSPFVDSAYELPVRRFPRLVEAMRDIPARDSVVLYGEIFGPGVQDLTYGRSEKEYRAFELRVDGHVMPRDVFEAFCRRLEIPMAPLLYSGLFHLGAVLQYASAPSQLTDQHMSEGVVVSSDDGRKLKFINEEYLLRREGTEFH